MLVALIVAGAAASCSSGKPTGHPAAAASPSTATAHAAKRLVGFWQVMSGQLIAPDELPEVVRFGGSPDDFADFRKCGVVTGRWRATEGGALVVYLPFTSTYCSGPGKYPQQPWMDSTSAYRFSGSHLLLLNDEGAVQAYLRPAKPPAADPGATAALLAPPAPTTALDDMLSAPAPLPSGMTPVVKPYQAAGYWLPPGSTSSDDALSLLGNHYLGTFGSCALVGQMAYDSDGVFVSLGEARGNCDALPLHRWLSAATRLGLDHGKLAFVDRGGHVLGELRRH